jgi:hypothetical protein
MADECPEGIRQLLEEVEQTPLPDAIAKRASWKACVNTWVQKAESKDVNQLWAFLWDSFDTISEKPEDTHTGLLLFLLGCCRLIYADRFVFKNPRNVLSPLLSCAKVATSALDKIDTDESRAAKEEVISAVSMAIQKNARNHARYLTDVVGTQRWRFDGSRMVFEDLAELRLEEIVSCLYDIEGFDQLRKLLDSAEDPPSWEALLSFVHQIIRSKWHDIGPQLREKWLRLMGSYSPPDEDPKAILYFYAPARQDQEWFRMAIEGLEDILSKGKKIANFERDRLNRWCACLQIFEKPHCDGGRALLEILTNIKPDKENFEVFELLLDHGWKTWEHSDIALLLCLIWHEHRLWQEQRENHRWTEGATERWKHASSRARSVPCGDLLLWLVERLDELPSERYYTWRYQNFFGPDERAAWRAEIMDRLHSKADLRRAASEFLLWCASGQAADDAELVVLNLLRTKKDRVYIRSLYTHVSRMVQLRARAIEALIEGRKDPALLNAATIEQRPLSETISHLRWVVGSAYEGRTWIRDRTVEDLIYGTITRVERTFCTEYPAQWSYEEPTLVTRLLTHLENEFRSMHNVLKDAVKHGLGSPVDIEWKYREIMRREEGEPGIGTESFSADIAFIVRVEAEGIIETERATIVQCKKLIHTGRDDRWETTFKINPRQRDDLITQTEASFYLFLVPPFIREECWITPARLIRSLMKAGKSKSVLARHSVERASRSLAHWLTFDLIGLWVGDERSEVLQKAKGDVPGRGPRWLVEISIRLGVRDQ